MEALLHRPDGCKLYYVIDDFSDAWRPAQTVLFVHGLAESTEAWRAWVPHFARRYRVVRVDLRGFGRSTPMPDEFEWNIDVLVDDLVALIRHLEVDRVHLVGAKSGGSMTLKLAADHPALVQTLTGVTPPVVGPQFAAGHDRRRCVARGGRLSGRLRGRDAQVYRQSCVVGAPPVGLCELTRVIERPDIREHYANRGLTASTSAPDKLAEYAASETAKWAKVVKAVGAKVD